MTIESIDIEDFRSHSHNHLLLRSFTILAGEYGSGKTSTMYAILAALIGRNALTDKGGKGIDDQIRRGAEKFSLVLSIVGRGAMFELRREKHRADDSGKSGKHLLNVGGMSGTKDALEASLLAELGTTENRLLELLSADGICSRDPQEQMSSMLSVFQPVGKGIPVAPHLVGFMGKHLNVRGDLRDTKHIESLWELAKKLRTEMGGKVKAAAPFAPKVRPDVAPEPSEATITKDLAGFRQDIGKLNQEAGQIASRRQAFERLVPVEVTEAETAKYAASRAASTDRELESSRAELNRTLATLNQEKGAIESRAQSFKALWNRCETETAPKATEDQVLAIDEKIKPIRLVLDEIEPKISDMRGQIRAAQQAKASLPPAGASKCTTCQREISSETRAGLIRGFEQSIAGLDVAVKVLDGQVGDNKRQLEALRTERDGVVRQIASYNAYRQSLDRLTQLQKQVGEDSERLPVIVAQIGTVEQDRDNLEAELRERSAFDRRAAAYRDYLSQKETVSKDAARLVEVEAQILHLEDRSRKGEEVLALRRELNDQVAAFDKWKGFDTEHAELESLCVWLGPKGIRRELFEQWSGPFLDAMRKAAEPFDRINTIDIDENDGLMVNGSQAKHLSGGESLVIELAYRIALATFTNIGVVAIDEANLLNPAAVEILAGAVARSSGLQFIVMLSADTSEKAKAFAEQVGATECYWFEQGVSHPLLHEGRPVSARSNVVEFEKRMMDY